MYVWSNIKSQILDHTDDEMISALVKNVIPNIYLQLMGRHHLPVAA